MWLRIADPRQVPTRSRCHRDSHAAPRGAARFVAGVRAIADEPLEDRVIFLERADRA
jgi:hypothetical protein